MATATDTHPAAGAPEPLTLGGLAIEGSDAAAFLQGYLTSDTEQLIADQGQHTALTTLKGRVLANGWAVARPGGVHLLLAADLVETVAAFLAKYLMFSKSKSRILSSAELEATRGTCELADLPSLEDPLQRQLFEVRLPLVTAPVSDQFLPQMLGLTALGAVDFSKGCYLGQEIVARAEHRGAVKRTLHAFRASAPAVPQPTTAPAAGDPVEGGAPQRQVGTIVLADPRSATDCYLLAVVAADAVAATDGPPPTLSMGDWTLTLLP